MAEKEYIVSLKRDVNYKEFDTEMVSSSGTGNIPNRTVDVTDSRPGSKRNTHYMLEESEAESLRNDNRVYGVEVPPDQRDDIDIITTATQTGDWRKDFSTGSSTDLNWGMIRGTIREDAWGEGISNITNPYNYTLTGKGVDVVISDTGLDVGHIEFTDSDGNSRVKQIDWFAESGLAGSQSVNHYRDFDGHGSHVAGTVAGRLMGWAKDANIYSVKVNGLEGSGDSGTGIAISKCFDVIKLWHRNKPIDPDTGFKRPTIVNMSWGYGGTRGTTVNSGIYRASSWTFGDTGFSNSDELYGNAGIIFPYYFGSRRINVRVSSVDTDIQELLDEGVHICIAAGNSYAYIAADGDTDWNNSADFGLGFQEFYHRGSSPYDTEAHIVGNMDITYKDGLENKAQSSCTGPGVDINAPGTEIISASSDDNASGNNDIALSVGRVAHPLNGSQYLMKISGTSMASPNVCGLLSTILEANPGMTPAELKTWSHNNATLDKLYNGATDDWDDDESIQGGPNRIFYTPFVSGQSYKTNNINLKGGSGFKLKNK